MSRYCYKLQASGKKWLIKMKLLTHYPFNAAAPLTISVSSVVIAAWRARL